MTKKRIGTKRRRVKKQAKRKSRKMRKSMRGGSRLFVQKIASCIPNNPTRFPDMPFSPTGYMYNDDNWTKLAENISHNGPIEFECDGKDAVIDGINLDTGTKKGKLYGKIGDSEPVLLWLNGRQQTYEPPPSNMPPPPPVTPPRTITSQDSPPPPNRRSSTYETNSSSPSGNNITRSLFNEQDNTDDDNRFSTSYRTQ